MIEFIYLAIGVMLGYALFPIVDNLLYIERKKDKRIRELEEENKKLKGSERE